MGLFDRAKRYVGHVTQHAKKIYARGTHLAKKVQSNIMIGAGKARHLIHDVKAFANKIQQIAPIATELVDEVSDFIPGVAPVKKGIRLGVSAFNTISSLADRADHGISRVKGVAENPNIRNVLSLFK